MSKSLLLALLVLLLAFGAYLLWGNPASLPGDGSDSGSVPAAGTADAPVADATPPPPHPAPAFGAGPLRGVVLDAAGEAVAKARVRAFRLGPDDWAEGSGRTASTGDDGRFAFPGLPAGPYLVEARRGDALGYLPLVGVTGEGGPDVVIRLAEAAAIEGYVLDEQGAPVPGAAVSTDLGRVLRSLRGVLDLGGARIGERLESVADEHGAFRISPLPAGEFDLQVEARGFVQQIVPLVNAPVGGVELTVLAGRTARGRVVGGGTFGKGLRVWVEPPGPRVEPGPKTEFTISGLVQGSYVVRAASDDEGDARADLLIEAGREPDPVVLRLGGTEWVRGRVTDGETGRSLRAGAVWLWPVDAYPASLDSEPLHRASVRKGSFKARVSPGLWVARALGPGYLPIEAILDAQDRSGEARATGHTPGDPLPHEVFRVPVTKENRMLELVTWPVRAIRGRVVGPGGWPVQGACVGVHDLAGFPRKRPPNDPRRLSIQLKTDLLGRFAAVDLVPLDTYHVRSLGAEERVTFPAGKHEAEVVLRVRPGGKETGAVRGRVVDERSRPVAGAVVISPGGSAVTMADGRFEISGIPTAEEVAGYPAAVLRLRYLALGYPLGVTDPFELKAGETITLGDLPLTRFGVVVRGRVHDRIARSIPGAWVRVRFAGLSGADVTLETRTDSQGRFEQAGPGTDWGGAVVTAGAPGYGTAATSVRTAPEAERVDLELPEHGSLTGRLSGLPGLNADWVDVAIRDEAGWSVVAAEMLGGGRFRLREIGAGRHKLRILAEDCAYASLGTVEILPSQERDIGTVEPGPCGSVTGRAEGGFRWGSRRLEIAEHDLQATVDGRGEFLIDHVPPGSWTLSETVPHKKMSGPSLAVEVAAGRTTKVIFRDR